MKGSPILRPKQSKLVTSVSVPISYPSKDISKQRYLSLHSPSLEPYSFSQNYSKNSNSYSKIIPNQNFIISESQKHISSEITNSPTQELSDENENFFSPEPVQHPKNKDFSPISDIELPVILSFSSVRSTSQTPIKMRDLPPLPFPEDPEFSEIFTQKLTACFVIFDFTKPTDLKDKECKGKILDELLVLFSNTAKAKLLNPIQQNMFFNMLEENIFRQEVCSINNLLKIDFSATIVEPSWPHLFSCYLLLNHFAELFPNSPILNFELATRAFNLTQLPDSNERLQLISFLKIYYETHINDQLRMLFHVGNLLIGLLEGIITPYCAGSLMTFLSFALQRFFSSKTNFKNFSNSNIDISFQKNGFRIDPTNNNQISINLFENLLFKTVIPLLSLKYLPMYTQSFKALISTFIKLYQNQFVQKSIVPLSQPSSKSQNSKKKIELNKCNHFELEIIHSLESLYPMTNGSKQKDWLEIFLTVLENCLPTTISFIKHKIFFLLGQFINAPNFKTSEIVIDLWNNYQSSLWLQPHLQTAIQHMYYPMSKTAENYWNKATQEKAIKALSVMSKVCPALTQQMKILRTHQPHPISSFNPVKSIQTWVQIAKICRNVDKSMDYFKTLKDIKIQLKNNLK